MIKSVLRYKERNLFTQQLQQKKRNEDSRKKDVIADTNLGYWSLEI